MTEPADLTATELRVAISGGAISPLEAVDASFARLRARQGLNAFMALCEQRAREEARNADVTLRRGGTLPPLLGLPFSVKDLTDTEGVATTYGSALSAGHVPTADAVAVARARAAGAVLIGKTTTPEFGHKAFTEGPLFGRTLNPWNPAFTCGGSSGGAAVAVATGMGPFALGTDGGGSIRIPAACCGVVGLKPTLGVIPNLQAPDLFAANSSVGPMARTVADVRLLFGAIAGHDRRDPYGQGAEPVPAARGGPLRIAWLPTCGTIVDAEVAALCEAAARLLTEDGASVEPIELDLASGEDAFLVLLRSLLLARLRGAIEHAPERLDPTLLATASAGAGYTALDLLDAQFARSALFASIQTVFAQYDLIASPTLTAPALPCGTDVLGRIAIAGRDAGTIRRAWYPYTFAFNLTGHPALSLPCGHTQGGLPVGFQLVGRWHSEALLLDTAAQLERRLGFRRIADLG